MTKLIKKLKRLVKDIAVLENCQASKYSLMRTGGIIRHMVFPNNAGALFKSLEFLSDSGAKYRVLGNGSNVLFSDGVIGTIIVSTKNVDNILIENFVAYADCGASLQKLSLECAKLSLSGLEFAFAIPASVGGAVAMNAGIPQTNMSNVLKRVYTDKNLRGLEPQNCQFNYRSSRFLNSGETVLAAEFKLEKKPREQIENTIKQLKKNRLEKQPQGLSLGSIFKNPKGEFAGKLIESCNLKGFFIGGAFVSDKHANFIINKNNATSSDVYNLVQYIKNTVYKETNITLNEEIQYIGNF